MEREQTRCKRKEGGGFWNMFTNGTGLAGVKAKWWQFCHLFNGVVEPSRMEENCSCHSSKYSTLIMKMGKYSMSAECFSVYVCWHVYGFIWAVGAF